MAVGTDLLALQKSHRFYVNAYYDRLVVEANRLIDEQYTPMLMADAINGKSGERLMEKVGAIKTSPQAAQDAAAFTERFFQNVKTRVDSQRTSIVGGIEAARKKALAQTEDAYTQVVQGQSTVTAYLASLVKLREAQNDLLTKAGLPNLQDDVAVNLAQASDAAGAVLTQAKTGAKTLDEVENSLEQLKRLFSNKN
jgi:hypothetical protein